MRVFECFADLRYHTEADARARLEAAYQRLLAEHPAAGPLVVARDGDKLVAEVVIQ